MNNIITAQKIDDKNYDLYLNGWFGDIHYVDQFFGGLTFKFGSWVLVQNTSQGTNEEVDYETDDLDEVIFTIQGEIYDDYRNDPEALDKFLELQ